MLFCLAIIAMLSEDCPQKKLLAYFRGNISKGELIQMDQSKQWMIAYSNTPVFPDCQIDQLKFVKPEFVEYLLAVENLASRFNIFINNLDSLTRNILLGVGDKVDVIMKQYAIPTAAIVKYKGKLPTKHGILFGIEILVSFSASLYTYGIAVTSACELLIRISHILHVHSVLLVSKHCFVLRFASRWSH